MMAEAIHCAQEGKDAFDGLVDADLDVSCAGVATGAVGVGHDQDQGVAVGGQLFWFWEVEFAGSHTGDQGPVTAADAVDRKLCLAAWVGKRDGEFDIFGPCVEAGCIDSSRECGGIPAEGFACGCFFGEGVAILELADDGRVIGEAASVERAFSVGNDKVTPMLGEHPR